jgi:8-hydroxy-5-deazaflavin:NADPH oxidoreductase
MRVGIVGAGMIGHALAVRFAAAGLGVMLSNSRGPASLADVVASIDGNVRAGTVADAARFGDVIAIAIPPRALPGLEPEPFAGAIVIDTNNYYPDADGPVPGLDGDRATSSEFVASLLPDATVVKAFNTLYFARLLHESHPELPPGERLAMPVAGDDAEAKRIVLDLIDRVGFTGVDAGSLADSRRQQPGAPLYSAFAEARRRGQALRARDVRAFL